jgi:hypothetical protein
MPIATRVLAASVALGAALTLTSVACTTHRTPAELRHDKVQARLQDSFSHAQANCIMGKLDPATIRALADRAHPPLSGVSSARYSDAVVGCVTGETIPRTTASAPAATTTAAPGTTTTKP